MSARIPADAILLHRVVRHVKAEHHQLMHPLPAEGWRIVEAASYDGLRMGRILQPLQLPHILSPDFPTDVLLLIWFTFVYGSGCNAKLASGHHPATLTVTAQPNEVACLTV